MESTKNRIYSVIQSFILSMTSAACIWGGTTIVEGQREVAVLKSRVDNNTDRIDVMEQRGSRTLESHVKSDEVRAADFDSRVSKIETAILNLATVNGKLDSISIKQEWMKETMTRVEAALDEHKRVTNGGTK